ncbi:MAG: sugar ABC transporter permease [Armatimonadota bacterium]|nr:sugar ABC transporter permease [Armatimonadota bacterium]MDR7402743.1 sugar ABC transporter permease [Armatimonadota bacterium]MDR7404494.1 sugar ABC transporter permease [Armatimonadota bacterium]MDR7437003.1 sugar ABC transporter permease [Armatimonadota bacterium]MDR7472926.1 sugar ABC transporter permease [Armatimonadota bacterium]
MVSAWAPVVRAVVRAYRRHYLHAYLFISPVLVAFGLFRVWPALQTLYFSAFRVELARRRLVYVGVENFAELLHDEIFRQAVTNTLLYAVAIVPTAAALGLILAVLFTERFPARELLKAVYFAPMVTSTVAAAVVWWWLYNPQYGLFNALLRMAHLPPSPWLLSTRTALLSVILFSIWKTVGYNMVIYIAGLQAIPAEFYEAATLDGAGPLQQFWRITLPLLAPVTAFLLIYNGIFAFQVFDQVYVLTGGGPANATNVVVLEIYRQAFQRYRFGYAAAEAVVLFVFILAITILQFRTSRRFEVTY